MDRGMILWVQKLKKQKRNTKQKLKRRLKNELRRSKKIVDLLIDTMILKEDDRNITMDLLMNIDK